MMTARFTKRRAACIAVGLAAWLSASGCHRSYYRQRADQDASHLVNEKAQHPHWALEDFTIAVNPESRLYDPNNPDCPPMPPDDPVSHRLMHCVDGKKGWKHWHDNGNTPYFENPTWAAHLPLNERGEMLVNADEAVRLGLRHSRSYQQQYEELYLSALDVSFERFRFDTQFFAGYGIEYTADGPLRDGSGVSSSTLTAGTFPSSRGVRLRKLGATGTDLVVGFANSLMWEFSGPDTNSASTLLDFSLIQPLLRNAGRDRVLERLTVAERTLVGNVRAMQRYQHGFYVQLLTGRDPGTGPSRRGGFFGGAGLDGFSGVGGGGFGRVGSGQTGGGAGTSAGAGIAGGYLGLLQIQQTIRNREFNITSLRINLIQLRESLEETKKIEGLPGMEKEHKARILRASLQVAQAQQALFNAESQLLNAKYDYESTLDTYKVNLGLPPQLDLTIEDQMIDPLRLLDQEILQLHGCLKDLLRNMGRTTETLLEREENVRDAGGVAKNKLEWTPEVADSLASILAHVKQTESFRNRLLDTLLPLTEDDTKRFEKALPQRVEQIKRLHEKIIVRSRRTNLTEEELCEQTALEIDPAVFDPAELESLPKLLKEQKQQLSERFRAMQQPLAGLIWDLEDLIGKGPTLDGVEIADRIRARVIFVAPKLVTDLASDTLNLMLLQARARVHSVVLIPIDLDPVTALDIARVNRLDWMNARAAVVDGWRLIQFNADQLQGTLDVVFSGDIANVGDNPLALSSATGRLRVGLQWDSPITRLAERNTYRQSLIEYQQSKRSYVQFVDQVARGLRVTLRTAEANQINFEARRHAVLSAVEQIIINDAIQTETPSDTSGATAARDSVSALSDLLNAQNDFLSVWVNYEVLRRVLDFDLGTMQLDNQGLWLDPGPIDSSSNLYSADVCPAHEILIGSELSEPTAAPAEEVDRSPPSRLGSNTNHESTKGKNTK